MPDTHDGPSRPSVPFLLGATLREPEATTPDQYPFHLPWLRGFSLKLQTPVTFFIGENGSGKSTLMEAIAALSGLPVEGGSRYEAGGHGIGETSELAKHLRPAFKRRPRDGYFFRAELAAHFASLLDQRHEDPDFRGDPYKHYGGQSLHKRSHGEAFLSLMQNRLEAGLFLMDEPESALSPQRQLTLLALIADRVAKGGSQFLIATHSPILLTYPGATLLSFDEDQLTPMNIEDTSHYQITRGILENPAMYWRHLLPE